MTSQQLQAAVRKGTVFLASQQAVDGSFLSFSSPVHSPFRPELTYHTVFTPALVLSAISKLTDHQSRRIRDMLAAWLLTQRSPRWSFNYWAATAAERLRLPYPDDLDDTFCALIALHQHNPSLIDETVLASVVKLLITTEAKVGGPYRTWLTDTHVPEAWKDIDIAVNANIAGFLRLVAEPLPNITQLMEQAIASQTFRSPYYPCVYPIIYYLARAYDGPLTKKLADYIVSERRNSWWGSPLPTALAITSLVRIGRADACGRALEQLLDSQLPDGSWPAEAFCIDPAIQNQMHYSGAAALTTAFVLEALTAFRPAAKPRITVRSNVDTAANLIYNQITETVQQDVKRLSPVLQQQIETVLKRTRANDDGHSITLLPYFFNQTLAKPLPTVSPELFTRLGAANMYGWTAYTVYDDFLDNEGDPQLLSAANAALRYSLRYFHEALPDNTAFQAYVANIFDTIDGANAWELAHCRVTVTDKTITIGKLPKYPSVLSLADRSIGHTLTPLAVLAAAGIPPKNQQAQHVSLALRHYIAARQLNDDLHDWEQDLRAGIITFVVARLLEGLSIPPGTHTFARLIPQLQRHFWHDTLPAVCESITHQTSLARTAARASGLLTAPNLITHLTQKIDDSVQHTIDEQTKAEAFLAAYTAPMK